METVIEKKNIFFKNQGFDSSKKGGAHLRVSIIFLWGPGLTEGGSPAQWLQHTSKMVQRWNSSSGTCVTFSSPHSHILGGWTGNAKFKFFFLIKK